MDTIYPASASAAIVVAVLLQAMKNSPYFPRISRNTNRINMLVSWLAAACTSAGLIYALDYDDATGDFLLKLHGNVWAIMHFAQHTIAQWSGQFMSYKLGVAVPEMLGEIRAMLAPVLEPPSVSTGEAKGQADATAETQRASTPFRLFPDKPTSSRPF